jgi:hypothetical protein
VDATQSAETAKTGLDQCMAFGPHLTVRDNDFPIAAQVIALIIIGGGYAK